MKLNAEKDTVTAAHYRVKSYPTVLVLQKDGTEIDRIVGYYRAPEFMAKAEDYLAGRNTLASVAAQEADSAGSATFLSALADRYFEHGLSEQARARYLSVTRVDPKNASGLTDDALYSLARMSRKDKDYATARAYAQQILDKYRDSDAYRPAILELVVAIDSANAQRTAVEKDLAAARFDRADAEAFAERVELA